MHGASRKWSVSIVGLFLTFKEKWSLVFAGFLPHGVAQQLHDTWCSETSFKITGVCDSHTTPNNILIADIKARPLQWNCGPTTVSYENRGLSYLETQKPWAAAAQCAVRALLRA